MATKIPENRAELAVGDIVRETGGTLVGADAHLAAAFGVSTDTRALTPEQVFVAIRGPSFDGHEHLAAAHERGARLAIVERESAAPAGLPRVRVESTVAALGALGRFVARRWRALGGSRRIIGITGSAGKTTTRVATSALLEALAPGEVLSTSGNLNNLIGVPMTLFGLLPAHRYAVVEMGTNQPGEIAALTSITEPDVGVVTLIAAAHVEGFGSIEAIAREKAALLEGLGADGVAIGNGDDLRVVQAIARSPARRRTTYGFGAGVDYRIARRQVGHLTSVRLHIERASRSSPESILEFSTPLLGEAGALASAAALAAVEGLLDRVISGETMSAAMERAEVGGGSGRLLPRTLADGLVVLDDSYNANPASMRASIEAAAEIARAMRRPLVLVLGEMRELGSASASGHDDIGRAAAASGAALVIAVAGEARRIAEAARANGVDAVFAGDSVSAAEIAKSRVTRDDFVLVKGSRGVATERVVAALVIAHGGERLHGREGAA